MEMKYETRQDKTRQEETRLQKSNQDRCKVVMKRKQYMSRREDKEWWTDPSRFRRYSHADALPERSRKYGAK